GPKGERVIPITDFFVGLFQTALAPDEILTEIRIPVPPPRSGGAYVKLERKVGDYATAAAAAQVTLDGSGAVATVGLAPTNVATLPVDAGSAAKGLVGKRPTADAIAATAKAAAKLADPNPDRRGSVEYKREMARVLAARALATAIARAGGH